MKKYAVTLADKYIPVISYVVPMIAESKDDCRKKILEIIDERRIINGIEEITEESTKFVEKATLIQGPYKCQHAKIEEEKDLESSTKLCPFSFDNGKMHPCQKDKCMAFKHIIDGSGEYVAEYCKLIDRKEK